MLVTGGLTFLVTVTLSMSFERRMDACIDQLRSRQVFWLTDQDFTSFRTSFFEFQRRWAVRSAWLIVATEIGALVVWAFAAPFVEGGDLTLEGGVLRHTLANGDWSEIPIDNLILLSIVCAIAGWIAGHRLGTTAAFGLLPWFLRRTSIALHLIPGHPDATAGLAPLGKYYGFQALLATIPALWLAVWWFIAPHWDQLEHSRIGYAAWREPFIGIWLVAVVYGAMSLVVPMYLFHRSMLRQKKQLVGQNGPGLASAMEATRTNLGAALSTNRLHAVQRRLGDLTRLLHDLHSLPVWPIEPRRVWRISQIYLTVLIGPLLVETLREGHADPFTIFEQIIAQLRKLILGA